MANIADRAAIPVKSEGTRALALDVTAPVASYWAYDAAAAVIAVARGTAIVYPVAVLTRPSWVRRLVPNAVPAAVTAVCRAV